MRRHRDAFGDSPVYRDACSMSAANMPTGCAAKTHVWTAATVAALQHAVRGNSRDQYRAYARIINEQTERLLTIRGMFRIKSAADDGRQPVPLDEVEPAERDRAAVLRPARCRSVRFRARRIPRSPSP